MSIDLLSFHTLVFDFDGVFTNNKVYIDDRGVESVQVSRADGYAIHLLRKFKSLGMHTLDSFILSTEKNHVVQKRANKLSMPCYQGIENKLEFLAEYLNISQPLHTDPFKGLIYFGNDLNDLPVIQRAGLTLCPADAHDVIKSLSHHISNRKGGDHFVRDGVEFLLGMQSLSTEEISALISNC